MFYNLFDPLERIPVRHDCGHFELRVTRWRDEACKGRGFMWAQSPCTQCDAQGRPVGPNYPTLEVAQAEALANPHRPRHPRP